MTRPSVYDLLGPAIADAERRGAHDEADRLRLLQAHWRGRQVPPLLVDREPPPFAGGQGRTAEDIEDDGAQVLWSFPWSLCVAAICAGVWALVAWLLGVL